MKEIVLSYLIKHYSFKSSNNAAFTLFDKISKTNIGLKQMLEHLKTIFSLDDDTVLDYFDEWSERELLIIETEISALDFPLL